MTPANKEAAAPTELSPWIQPSPWMQWIYLALAVAGAIFPWLANAEFIREYGQTFDLSQFIELANANPAARSLSRDLLIGATAVTIWIINEARRLKMRGLWIVLLGSVTIAFAFAAPFFLFLRERRLLEISRQATTDRPLIADHAPRD